jgi:hypothetical protein
MENLVIQKTDEKLGVDFNAENGKLELSGSSYPENTIEFFEPIVNWISSYMLEVTGSITMDFRLDYLNSSSIKFISDIIDKLSLYSSSGAEVVVNWHYKEDDEDILEMGEDLKEDTSLTFNLIEED